MQQDCSEFRTWITSKFFSFEDFSNPFTHGCVETSQASQEKNPLRQRVEVHSRYYKANKMVGLHIQPDVQSFPAEYILLQENFTGGSRALSAIAQEMPVYYNFILLKLTFKYTNMQHGNCFIATSILWITAYHTFHLPEQYYSSRLLKTLQYMKQRIPKWSKPKQNPKSIVRRLRTTYTRNTLGVTNSIIQK